MIKINLLPVRDIKRRIRAKKEIYLALTAFLALIVLLTLLALFRINTINAMQDENRKLQREKEQYTHILNEIKKLEADKQIIETRIGVIEQLNQSSSLTVRVMDEVARMTPPQRMWLTGLSQTGSSLRLTGMALDNQTVAAFMDDLTSSPLIGNVVLANSSLQRFAERDLIQFSISCSVSIPDPQTLTQD
ncbi:PilN domain-containing protein [Desulfobulbus alkaliphilus]|uniref:PilN domain-containing protein n=1 Tax=Desulfobulbus alkaliphilus TaxID=869814 RepID=UPI001964CFCB|nr:PilN domain-containing protein [Desulfobulbus alkaliphilus]MBM9536599.1 PilN domain-containing protein [Desulfobulbus alkaliphilus]